MIAVIQCAARKQHDAGCLRKLDGRKVLFVADPDAAPTGEGCVYARPDDMSDRGKSWRTVVHEYNDDPGDNPYALLAAWQLYRHPTYKMLADHLGLARLYILSAGWGMISADYLTPAYDITFSASADKHMRRRKNEPYNDFHMLPIETSERIVFFGGKDYRELFRTLTAGVKGPRHLWYNSATAPQVPGVAVHRFHTKTRTNWHYECARAFAEGKIQLSVS